MSKLFQMLEKVLSKQLEKASSRGAIALSRLASVDQGSHQDATLLVGKKWPLRTSKQLMNGEAWQLLTFDPNFRRPEVYCRHPGCSVMNPDPPVLKRHGHSYLCPTHMDATKSRILNMFQKEGVMAAPYQQSEDLSDYIQLIPKLEKIYREAQQWENWLRSPSKSVQEAVLNVRNFLVITNVLLNPNGGNLEVVLPPVLVLLQWIISDEQRTRRLLNLLRGVIQLILLTFRVAYNWIGLGIAENPGAAIGAGAGGFVGMFGGISLGPFGSAGLGAGGAACGGLIGGGIDALFRRPLLPDDFQFEGNARGDLIMNIR